jgi:hypothetical protein
VYLGEKVGMKRASLATRSLCLFLKGYLSVFSLPEEYFMAA